MRVGATFLLGAAAIALSAQTLPALAGKADDTLIYASNQEVDNMSPYFNNQREGLIIGRHVFDTLVYLDPNTGEYKPQLATSWKWESPTSLVMDIRQGVTFHNGDKLTAADVAFTFNTMNLPETKVATRSNQDWIKSVDVIGDYQVRFNLHKPFPAALDYLSGPLPIYPEAYYKKVGASAFAKALVGTGPYKVTD